MSAPALRWRRITAFRTPCRWASHARRPGTGHRPAPPYSGRARQWPGGAFRARAKGRMLCQRRCSGRLPGGRTSMDLRPGMRLFSRIVYPIWNQFEQTVRSGQPARLGPPPEGFSQTFSDGIAAFTQVTAATLPDRDHFGRHRRILDVGGGTGSYLVSILGRHPHLRGTLFELPPPAEVARARIAGQPAGDRIDIVEGDALFDPLPEGHDVVLVASVIHLLIPKKIRRSCCAAFASAWTKVPPCCSSITG